ncbi:hypothetical protein GGTG_06892 [Gaeumannomyces tritici R3-111a-1]|uniref:Uncharacterized protein n=1 Tax=Gaeumannomyces tritici (strain R3-111a-1) TaxID=644352 RepID=J3P045_GAET3|nr:hypothetical protein GGTG_06892 [Gaeumannomyces tritici R3-111a-1]EJT76978.1 hypothetical protein GGTG_06892 [Gaeumannomyces tritici R3-111a-1]
MATLLYFRAPRFDISPESPTAPRLGSIFSNLRRLTAPLNQDEALSIPANLVNQAAVAGFQDKEARSVAGSAGLCTGGGGGSGGLMYAFASDRRDTYRCAELETVEFEADEQFVRDSITASRRVQDFFQGGGSGGRGGGISSFLGGLGGRRVYLITGLKIATDFTVSRGGGSEHGVVAQATVSGGGGEVMMPASAGLNLELKTGSSREVSHGPASGKIVFAYRAIKIRPAGHGQVRYKDLSGGQYGIGEDDGGGVEPPVSWEVEPVGEKDILEEFPDEEEIVAIQH